MNRARMFVGLLLVVFLVGLVFMLVPREPSIIADYDYYYHVKISKDGNYIVAGGTSEFVLFSKSTAIPLWKDGTISHSDVFDISADGKYVAVYTVSLDGGHLTLIKENGETMWVSDAEWVTSMAISDNGDYIVVGASSGLYLFTNQDNVPRWSYSVDAVNTVAISGDGSYMMAGTENEVYLFTNQDNMHRWVYSVGGASVAISDNGEYIVVGASSGVYLFERVDNVPQWIYPADSAFVAISDNGDYMMAASDYVCLLSADNNLIWSDASSRISIRPRISSDGRYLAFTDLGYRLYVYDRIENSIIRNVWYTNIFNRGRIGSISISSDGNYIALGVTSFGPPKDNEFVALFSVPENRVLWVY